MINGGKMNQGRVRAYVLSLTSAGLSISFSVLANEILGRNGNLDLMAFFGFGFIIAVLVTYASRVPSSISMSLLPTCLLVTFPIHPLLQSGLSPLITYIGKTALVAFYLFLLLKFVSLAVPRTS